MVFVLNKRKKSMNMCTNAKARYLLDHGYAVVHKVFPFTIRLKSIVDNKKPKNYILKIDPGSKITGFSILDTEGNVVFLATLEHRGALIKGLIETRNHTRRNRRQRETRYRKCKFINKPLKKDSKYKATTARPEGWLPPSVDSIVNNILNFIKKYQKLCNITQIYIESVKFDSQLMDNPNIEGVEYQQGTLFGYELREYLLEKYGHNCQYCYNDKTFKNESGNEILEVEHMISKKNGGSNSVKNLNISCVKCNKDKGSLNLEQWLEKLKGLKSTKLNEIRIKNIESILKSGAIKKSNRYSAYVNSYRNKLIRESKCLCKDIILSSGGKTKFNRITAKLPKEHYYDALCVSELPNKSMFRTNDVLNIKANGRGSRFRGTTDSRGLIISRKPRTKTIYGFQTGDMVKAVVTKGKKVGTYYGRVAIRSTGNFNITTKKEKVQGINYRYAKVIQRNDGYSYTISKRNIA